MCQSRGTLSPMTVKVLEGNEKQWMEEWQDRMSWERVGIFYVSRWAFLLKAEVTSKEAISALPTLTCRRGEKERTAGEAVFLVEM